MDTSTTEPTSGLLTGRRAPAFSGVLDLVDPPEWVTEMKSQFRQLIESSLEATLVLDGDGRIRQANVTAASLFGYDRERLREKSVQSLLPHQPSPPFVGDSSGPAGRRLESIGRRSDSSEFPAEVQIVRIHTEHGPAAVVTVRDITEIQRARSVLERALDVLTSADRDRQFLLGHLIGAQEEERKRIAAGIHDDTIQMLTAAHLRVQQLRHRLKTPAELDVLDKLEEALQLSLGRLRQLIFDLGPSSVEDGNLVRALGIYLDELHSVTGIAYRLDNEVRREIPLSTAMLIYRTAQEALINVGKHARASAVRVTLADLSNGWLVRVTDDGVGYNPAEVENRPGHLGLVLMRERPQIAGGWCRIESAPGAGTTVEFWVPAGSASEGAVTAA